MKVTISTAIAAAAPALTVYVFETAVKNPPTSDALWQALADEAARFASMPIDRIRHRPAIAATREAYKALGKEPNRYRPSAEALMRRVVTGKELYRTTAIVDLINLASISTGHSIGAFDADKIEGDCLELGVGAPGEPYEAIGRGQLNIEGLPVFRDAIGGIGTPTSDNARTCLSESTTRLLVTLNCYGTCETGNDKAVELIKSLLVEYADADSDMTITRISPSLL